MGEVWGHRGKLTQKQSSHTAKGGGNRLIRLIGREKPKQAKCNGASTTGTGGAPKRNRGKWSPKQGLKKKINPLAVAPERGEGGAKSQSKQGERKRKTLGKDNQVTLSIAECRSPPHSGGRLDAANSPSPKGKGSLGKKKKTGIVTRPGGCRFNQGICQWSIKSWSRGRGKDKGKTMEIGRTQNA